MGSPGLRVSKALSNGGGLRLVDISCSARDFHPCGERIDRSDSHGDG